MRAPSSSRTRPKSGPAADTAEREIIIATLKTMVAPLAQIIPGQSEVVLHDLSILPNSIVALEGSLTGRSVGGLATDMLLERAAQGRLETRIGYLGRGVDGRQLRCSTIIVRTNSGAPVAALCFNCDTTVWTVVANLAASMLPALDSTDATPAAGTPEHFIGDVDDLAAELLAKAIGSVSVPVHLMRKTHKLAVVAELRDSGFFILREAAERAARALEVSRFTIYNYLKELDGAPEQSAATDGR
ncbi:MAG: helix-turn-helix transcriptional regulator [Propionibacteriaceae bacterium]|jgi:predicted transcriptional regulator YheO|nr:helix-turn-helix transcriptional regulator [Propionibacteriaceae bacterium]